jgi:hypothetical protein
MATKKKSRKQTGMINLATLRRLAKKAFGDDTKVGEGRRNYDKTWDISTTGSEGLCISHLNRATARRMLKAALEAAVKKG